MDKKYVYCLVEEEYEGVEDPFYIMTDKNCRNDLSIIIGRWYSTSGSEAFHNQFENQMDYIIKSLQAKGYQVFEFKPEKVNIQEREYGVQNFY